MASNTQSPLDIEIIQQKVVLQNLRVRVRSYMAGYSALPFKERARGLQEIQKTLDSLGRFFDKIKGANIQNTGTKFAAENLKQSYFTLKGQWRKFELSLNTTQAS